MSKASYVIIAIVVITVVTAGVYYLMLPASTKTPTPTPSPTLTPTFTSEPTTLIDFETAVKFALKGGKPRWMLFGEYQCLESFKNGSFATPDGLVEGRDSIITSPTSP